MKKRFLFVILTLYLLLNSALPVSAASVQDSAPDPVVMYGGIIAILCATVGVAIYVIYTYLKK